jgi:hypothetical protein
MMQPRKFNNQAELNCWLAGILDGYLGRLVADMRAAGHTEDDIADAMPVLIELSERARLDVLAQVERVMLAPSAPTHSLN